MPQSYAAARSSVTAMNPSSSVSVSNPADFLNDHMLVITDVVNEFIGRVQSNIKKQDLVVTGSMQSINVKVEGSSLSIECEPWLLYQDRGVKGVSGKGFQTPYSFKDKMPPVNVFKKWIREKGIPITTTNKNKNMNDEQKITSAAWAMSRSVYEKGISPKRILSKEIPKLIEDLGIDLSAFTGTQIKNMIQQAISVKK